MMPLRLVTHLLHKGTMRLLNHYVVHSFHPKSRPLCRAASKSGISAIRTAAFALFLSIAAGCGHVVGVDAGAGAASPPAGQPPAGQPPAGQPPAAQTARDTTSTFTGTLDEFPNPERGLATEWENLSDLNPAWLVALHDAGYRLVTHRQ